jgi:hypothetical protein
MTKNGFDGLFELSVEADQEPYQDSGLNQRTRFQSRAPRAGADFKAMAVGRLKQAGANVERLDFEIQGFPVDAQVSGENGRTFLVLARGTPDEQPRSGLRRSDTVLKVGFVAMQLARCQEAPILLLVSDLPQRSTRSGHYLAALSNDVWDVVAYRGDFQGFQRLRDYFRDAADGMPPAAPWRIPDVSAEPSLFDAKHASTKKTPVPAVNLLALLDRASGNHNPELECP